MLFVTAIFLKNAVGRRRWTARKRREQKRGKKHTIESFGKQAQKLIERQQKKLWARTNNGESTMMMQLMTRSHTSVQCECA